MKLPPRQQLSINSFGPDLPQWSLGKPIITDSACGMEEALSYLWPKLIDKEPGEKIDAEEARILAAATEAYGRITAASIEARTAVYLQECQHEHEKSMQERQHQHEEGKQ